MESYLIENAETEETISKFILIKENERSTPIYVKVNSNKPSDEAIERANRVWTDKVLER